MQWWISLVCCLTVLGHAHAVAEYDDDPIHADTCELLQCVGEEFSCVDGKCYCASGYIPTPFHSGCMKCPGYRDACYGRCCGNGTGRLECWHGTCRVCYDPYGNWTCRESLDQVLLVTVTQIALATALVFGIIITFLLLCKLCAAATIRPMVSTGYSNSRLSIGSLQLYVDERLRDAPPRYTGAPSATPSTVPVSYFVNAGFVHDSSVPPPPYAPPERKDETNTTPETPTLHI